jgi:nitrite reductase/ring-hydroxylating ferredoxin subunit
VHDEGHPGYAGEWCKGETMTTESRTEGEQAVLPDGTALSELIDHEKREVLTRVYSDPDIHEMELARLWSRQWVVLGHESEIPNAGDFVTRRIAADAVILSRDRDGQIQCMLNMCPHRGAQVCRREAGNESAFRCIYHGWVFGLDGSFRGAPYSKEIYPEGVDATRMGLRKARVEVFGGIIFANWDDDAPSLEDSLGDFKWYLNMMFNRPKNGLEVLGAPQRFIVNANWKVAAEQFACDALHAGQLHRSLAELTGADRGDAKAWQLYAPTVSTPEAHSIICFDQTMIYEQVNPDHAQVPALAKLTMLPPPGVPAELVPELNELFSEAELQLMADSPPSNGSIFPNVGLWNMTGMQADRSMAPYLSFRTYAPLGVDKFEFTMWTLVARDASREYRDELKKTLSFGQGAAGFVEQDDGEVWPGIASSSRGYIGRQTSLKYWALAGDHPPENWPGAGSVHTGISKDDPQWVWWQRYFKEMNGAR